MGDKLMMMPNRVSVEVMNLWLDQVYQKRNLAWFARGMACTDRSLLGRLVGRGGLYHRWRERASKIEGYFRRGKIEYPAVALSFSSSPSAPWKSFTLFSFTTRGGSRLYTATRPSAERRTTFKWVRRLQSVS